MIRVPNDENGEQMKRQSRTIAVMLLLFVCTNVASAGQVLAWAGYSPRVPSRQLTPTGEALPFLFGTPNEKLSFVCNSSNGTLNAISIFPTGKIESSAEPFYGPLTVTLQFFVGKPYRSDLEFKSLRWYLELETPERHSLFDWQVDFEGVSGADVSSLHANTSLKIERKEKEIESVTISFIARDGRTVIIERDYKSYTFLATIVSQTTEKHADELNIVTPHQRLPIRPSQTIFWLSGSCVKREGPISPQ
jgi:hypothetical protein